MFNPHIYENSRPDGIPVLEVAGGNSGQTPSLPFVPLQRTALRGTVTGPLADLHLTQVFGFAHTAYAHPIEARYCFPLPGDAAVQGVTVHFGDVEIVAALQERSAAEATYATAKTTGRQAALATRESPDLFTLQITGIQPDQPVTIATHYVQLARQEQRAFSATGTPIPQWSLRIPLTTAPRYVRADERAGRWGQGQPLALLRDPGHRFQLDLTFHGVADVTSPTHKLSSLPNSSLSNSLSLQVQLADGEVLPDRDCLLRWSPPQATSAPTIQVLTYEEKPDEQAQQTQHEEAMLYFLAIVTPPSQRTTDNIHREATVIVDHSGSMRGAKWAAADWAVERFLTDLGDQDAFALATFHNQTRWFADAVQPAEADKSARAVAWLQAQKDSGGTELGVALEQALQLPRPQPNTDATVTRHLLIVTDAAVSDGARILRLADVEAQRPNRRRISVLCIDAAPNAFLAHELAERGGGVARFLTSDPAADDIVTALDDLLFEWSEPLLVNMQLTINRPQVIVSGHQPLRHAAGATDHETVIDLGDLPAGHTQWIVGRLPRAVVAGKRAAPHEALTLSLSVDHAGERRTIAKLRTEPTVLLSDTALLDPVSSERAGATGSAAIKALFGARRVNALEFLMNANFDEPQLHEQLRRLGYDPRAVFANQPDGPDLIYAENRQKRHGAALRNLLVQEALQYGLASAETAFVATRTEAGEPVAATVTVANALPAGWSGDFGTVDAMARRIHLVAGGLAEPSAALHALPAGRGMGAQMRQMVAPAFLPAPASSTGFAAGYASTKAVASETPMQHYTLFTGVPQFVDNRALLFASDEPGSGGTVPDDQLPTEMTISAISLKVTGDQPPLSLDRSTTIAIYIDDPITPRATMRLVDLLRHGSRPLNLQRPAATPLRITLDDPTGSLRRMSVKFSLTITVR